MYEVRPSSSYHNRELQLGRQFGLHSRVKNFKDPKCIGVTVTAPYKYVTCHHVQAIEIRRLKGKWYVGVCASEVIIPITFINVGHFIPKSIEQTRPGTGSMICHFLNRVKTVSFVVFTAVIVQTVFLVL